MPLPTILQPSIVPPFLVAGHASQWGNPFVDTVMTTGHRRKRRVCTVRPQVVAVSQFLEADEMAAFQRWYRDTLRNGERHFAARVKEQGVGMLWYDAFWVEPYRATAMHKGRWTVEGQLQLIGAGQAEDPTLGGFHARVRIDLVGQAELTVTKAFHAAVIVELLTALPAVIET